MRKKSVKKERAEYFSKIGSIGGSRKVPKGFARMDPVKRAEANRKGGQVSRRGPKE